MLALAGDGNETLGREDRAGPIEHPDGEPGCVDVELAEGRHAAGSEQDLRLQGAVRLTRSGAARSAGGAVMALVATWLSPRAT